MLAGVVRMVTLACSKANMLFVKRVRDDNVSTKYNPFWYVPTVSKYVAGR